MTDTKEERTPSQINTKPTIIWHTILKLREILDKKKILRQIESGKSSYLERKKGEFYNTSHQEPCTQEEGGIKILRC